MVWSERSLIKELAASGSEEAEHSFSGLCSLALWLLEMVFHLGLYKAFCIQGDCFCNSQEYASELYGSGWKPGLLLGGCHRAGRVHGLSVEGTRDGYAWLCSPLWTSSF